MTTNEVALTENDADIALLAGLAGGATVAQLAAFARISERDLYARLNELFVRMGARNRGQAVKEAIRRGWLESSALPNRPPEGL